MDMSILPKLPWVGFKLIEILKRVETASLTQNKLDNTLTFRKFLATYKIHNAGKRREFYLTDPGSCCAEIVIFTVTSILNTVISFIPSSSSLPPSLSRTHTHTRVRAHMHTPAPAPPHFSW